MGCLTKETLAVCDCGELLQAHGLRTFADFMDFPGGEPVARKRGRTVVRLQLAGHTFYLKRNRFHSGEFRKTLSRFRLPPRGALQEWQSILAVRDAGIATVPPVAMGEQLVCGLETASFTLTEALYDTEPLDVLLRRGYFGLLTAPLRRQKRDLLRRVAEIARHLHGSGMYHQDLYLGHFLLAADNSLYLIDLQRVVRCGKVPRRYLVKDLGQLAFSAAECGLSRSDQMRMFLTYLGASRLAAADKALLRRVLGKRNRIARHTVKLLERRRRRGEIS